MLAAHAAAEFDHEIAYFLHHRDHLVDAVLILKIDARADVQATDTGMAVVTRGGVVVGDDLPETPQEFRQLGRVHRRILHECHRLAGIPRSHQYSQPGLAHFPDVRLRRRRQGRRVGIAPFLLAQGRLQLLDLVGHLLRGVPVKLRDDQRVRLALQERQAAVEFLGGAGPLHDLAVDHLDGRGLIGKDRLGGFHRRDHVLEVRDQHRSCLRARHDAYLGRRNRRQGTLGADDHFGQIDGRVGDELVQVVAAHTAQQFGVAFEHRVPVVLGNLQHAPVDAGFQGAVTQNFLDRRLLHGLEQGRAAIGKHDLELEDVVNGLAVQNRARAGRVVADHAANGCPAAGRRVRTEQEAVRPQVGIELVLHHAGLYPRPVLLGVQFQHLMHVVGHVHDDRPPHALTGEGRAAAARQHRYPVAARHAYGCLDVIGMPGYHHS